MSSGCEFGIIASLDSGGTLTKVAYQAFGESATAVASGPGPRYTARRLDPETATGSAQPNGLYYYRARTYSPTWGRFLQPDPIGPAGGINLYAYVRNDPLNLVDPSGLAADQLQSAASSAYNSVLAKPLSDIGDLINNPSQIPGALASALPGVAPVAGELPQLLTGLSAVGVAGTDLLGGSAATDHIVLGLTNAGLQDTAAQLGGRTLLGSTNLVADFQAAMANPATRFTISLEGLAGSTPTAQLLTAAQRGAAGLGGGYTNYEIAQLYQAGRLATVNLVRGGVSVPNPFAP